MDIKHQIDSPRTAYIDTEALRLNASKLQNKWLDLRADAYGFGIKNILHAISDYSFAGFIVDSEVEIAHSSIPIIHSTDITNQTAQDLPTEDELRVNANILYGVTSSPTVTLKIEIIGKKTVKSGNGISYGHRYHTPEDTVLAQISAGYADGLPRIAMLGAPVSLNGKMGRIVGAVPMNTAMVKLPNADFNIGDAITLFGTSDYEPNITEWDSITGIDSLTLYARMLPLSKRIWFPHHKYSLHAESISITQKPVTYAEIDTTALAHNIKKLSTQISPAQMMLVVKADAYGHGALETAKIGLKSGAHLLGTLDIETAVSLRKAGFTAPIFAWQYHSHSPLINAILEDIELGCSTLEHLQNITNAYKEFHKPCPKPKVHLKLNTGLNRAGANPEEWETLLTTAHKLEEQDLIRIVGIWSHLSGASASTDIQSFMEFQNGIKIAKEIGVFPAITHIAASEAAISIPELRLNLARIGLATYGISPIDNRTAEDLDLIPVMNVKTSITGFVGKNAIIPFGISQGLLQRNNCHGKVFIKDRLFTVTEAYADYAVVRTDFYQNIEIGDSVTVFGSAQCINGNIEKPWSAEQWAHEFDTVPDEILTSAGTRLPRIYL